MSYFENKIVLVTGGTEGIGKALVDALIMQGAKVATCGRSADKLYNLQKLYAGKPFITYTADVSNENECAGFINKAVKTFGSIDVLINNAGISMRALFEETNLSTLKKVMEINFWGTVYCTKHALPYIQKKKGDIVAVSSVAGFRGLPGRTGYCASKFAVNGFMEALRTEMLNTGVNIMWVCPGFTTSNIRNAALTKNATPQGASPMKEEAMMTAEECAEHILRAITKHKRSPVFTFKDRFTVFLNHSFPSLADRMTKKFFYKNGELIK